MSDEEIERSLLTGENSGALEDYFGLAQYEEVRRLAQSAARRSVRGGDRILILPGIMGSKLGYRRKLLPPDLVWVDPTDIAIGRLSELAIAPARGGRGKAAIEPVGVILLAYLSLKFRLRLAGFDADFYPYDWRHSLKGIGRALARVIDAEPRKVQIVAHSMGGLVARAALESVGGNLSRVVMLGTPNFGSFSPVQAFRGVGGTVTKLAWLDQKHDAAGLADIFGTFAGLIEMIPAPAHSSSDLFEAANWPNSGKSPSAKSLAAARRVQDGLPQSKPGVEIIMIAGTGQETVVDARAAAEPGKPGEFLYTFSKEGDGTVPLKCALLPTADRTYYVAAEHGSMPGNRQIQSALPSILATGETAELRSEPLRAAASAERTVHEQELRRPDAPHGAGLPGARDKRQLLAEFAAPEDSLSPLPSLETAANASFSPESERFSDMVVVGRGRQQRLELTLVKGSITDVDAGLYVLGMFKNVDPVGAALAVDAVMDGSLSQMVSRRMFGANVGEISILPSGRHPMRSEGVAFAGLGPFDSFTPQVLEIVAENLIRTMIAARVDDFAMVSIGANSGELSLAALQRMICGLLRGLKDADRDQRFRGITICELDPQRFELIRNELYRLSATTLFDNFEVVFRERVVPARHALPVMRAAGPETSKVYLIVREEAEQEGLSGLTSSVLTSGAKAAIVSGHRPFNPEGGDALGVHLGLLDGVQDMTGAALTRFGETLGELVLSDNVRQALETCAEQHLVVVHDAAASQIPWETLRIRGAAPAVASGISHRYESADLSVAKWLQRKQLSERLNLLLVINPTNDLAAAAKEGRRVREQLDALGAGARYRLLEGAQARKSELMRCFSSGEFDVIHYAGHAFFDAQQRSRSGLICADREVLSGEDLAGVGNLPPLVFFNACEAARVRTGRDAQHGSKPPRSEEVRRNIGVAEALLRGGIANFIGTYWPVGDTAAGRFAEIFYTRLLAGAALNLALIDARRVLIDQASPDWADYVFYGDPDFRLKVPS
jgi:pimeloyl-ACP methyl ester carboxylesterase